MRLTKLTLFLAVIALAIASVLPELCAAAPGTNEPATIITTRGSALEVSLNRYLNPMGLVPAFGMVMLQTAAPDCDRVRQTCADGAFVIKATCLSQNGSETYCEKQSTIFFQSCMKQSGCSSALMPVPVECPEWCRDWYLGRCMC